MSIETIMVDGVSVQVIDVGQPVLASSGYKISADGRVFSNKIGGRYREIGPRSLSSEFLDPRAAKPSVPGGRWFVALIENGIPKFSSSPVGHKDEASAKMEASRLAREHSGKKFGVFHMVTSCVASKEIWE